MLTNNIIKYIQSLSRKKYRDEYATFVVESLKPNLELITQIRSQYLIATKKTIASFESIDLKLCENVIIVDERDFNKLTTFKTPQNVLVVYYKPKFSKIEINKDELILALDDIQDPGNLGTIIRLADWYGIADIVCSQNTVDAYNPKVVQATMGAIARVKVHYLDLELFLKQQVNIPIYGTLLDGENIYEKKLTKGGIIIMGNEGNGISKSISNLISEKLFIPPYPIENHNTESLNVSIATAIICSEFRRRLV